MVEGFTYLGCLSLTRHSCLRHDHMAHSQVRQRARRRTSQVTKGVNFDRRREFMSGASTPICRSGTWKTRLVAYPRTSIESRPVDVFIPGTTKGKGITSLSFRLLVQFIRFGTLRSVWVARKPPGFGKLSSLSHHHLQRASPLEPLTCLRHAAEVSYFTDEQPVLAAFIEFEDTRDAEDAIRKLDGGKPMPSCLCSPPPAESLRASDMPAKACTYANLPAAKLRSSVSRLRLSKCDSLA